MKKIMFVFLAGMLFVLSACAGDDTNNEDENDKENSVNTEEQDDTANDEADDDDSDKEETEDGDEDKAEDSQSDEADDESDAENEGEDITNSELAELPEYDTLVAEMDVDSFEADVETDNSNTRVILYENTNGQEEYKSVFVKDTNRLKIIHFDDEGQIFNEIIK